MSLEAVPVAEAPAPVVDAPVTDPTTPTEADAITETQTLQEFEQKQPRRHRAHSQQARPDDVPRIAELTKKLRETEAERDALKAPKVEPAAAAPVAARTPVAEPPRVIAADKDPEPTEALDPSTGKPYEDFTKFTRDSARWAAREEMRTARKAHEDATANETASQEHARLATAWTSNVEAAKALHKDFESVAYGPSEIPSGSLVDRWIREHPAGPLVLYSLKKNPTELRAMLALPLFEQTEALSLLSQRLKPRSVAAVSTGAAPVMDTKPVPRPPTPVRTGPMRTEPAVPDTEELSLDDFAEATGATKKRRA